jgi:hypothetical protein
VANINAYFDRRAVGDAVVTRRKKCQFLLKKIFHLATARAHHVDVIERDVVKQGRRMAPVITNLGNIPAAKKDAKGKIIFKIPMVALKAISKAEELFRSFVGVSATAELNPQQIKSLAYAYNDTLGPLDDAITDREEWYCAKMLEDGKVTVSGVDEAGETIDFEIDFMRDPDLKIALTDTAQWGETGVSPYEDIIEWRELVATKDIKPDNVLMGSKAIRDFLKDPEVRALLDLKDARFGSIAPEELQEYGSDITYYGNMPEVGHIWSSTEKYVDEAGELQYYVHPDAVILFSDQPENCVDYGAIGVVDDGDNIGIEISPRVYAKETNKGTATVIDYLKSKPMPGLWKPDTTLYARVREEA